MFVCVHVFVCACMSVYAEERVFVSYWVKKLTLVFVRACMIMELKPLMKVLVVNKEKVSSLQFKIFPFANVHLCLNSPKFFSPNS